MPNWKRDDNQGGLVEPGCSMQAGSPRERFSVVFHNSTGEVPPVEWDAIVAHDMFVCRHSFLSALEASRIEGIQLFFPVVYSDSGEILAHTLIYLIKSEIDIFASGISKKVITLVRKVWPDVLSFRTLECGSPVALGNCFSLKKGIDRNAVLSCFLSEIEKHARRHKASTVVVRDFTEAERLDHNDFPGRKYSHFHQLPLAVLELKWDSFEDYVQSLRSPYRYKLKKHQKRLEKDEIRVEYTSDFSLHAVELQRLWENVFQRADELKREYLDVGFFREMGRNDLPESRAILIWKNDKIIGFSHLILDDDTVRNTYIGLDYELNQTYSLYYNLMYLAIDFAIKKNKRCLDFGLTTYEPKSRIGCHFISLYIYVHLYRPIANLLCGPILRMMNPPVPTPERRVFLSE